MNLSEMPPITICPHTGRAFIGKTRHTSILDEKIIVEDPDSEALIEEKSLVDTVYALRDQVATLIQEQKKCNKRLEEESKARRKLENLIRRSVQQSMMPDGSSGSLPTINDSRESPSEC